MASKHMQGTNQQHKAVASLRSGSTKLSSVEQRRQRSWPTETYGSGSLSPLTEANIKKRKSFDFVHWALEKRKPPVTAKLAVDSLSATQSEHSNGGTQTRRSEHEEIEDLDRWMAACDKIAEAGGERMKSHLAK